MRTILFLAVNPRGTERLRLDEEVRRVEQTLERSRSRDDFRLVVKWAATDDDLRRALLDTEPEVVHFSGHGGGADGLAFEGDDGEARLVSGDALARLFALCARSVRCVVLNACDSVAQATPIARHIDYAIGMTRAMGDAAALKFALGFYDALAAGRSYETAFRFGCNAVELMGLPEHTTPVLKQRRSPTVPKSERGRPQPSLALPAGEVREATARLAEYLGPLAEVLTARAATRATSRRHLYEALASEIDAPADRAAFLATAS